MSWLRAAIEETMDNLLWLEKFRKQFPNCPLSYLPIYIRYIWRTTDEAIAGMEQLKDIVKYAKHHQIFIKFITPRKRNNMPFFFLPELFENWTEMNCRVCWLEFLSYRYGVGHNTMSGVTD